VSVLHIGSLTTRASSPSPVTAYPRHSHVHPCVLSPLVSHGETSRDTVYIHGKATEENPLFSSSSSSGFSPSSPPLGPPKSSLSSDQSRPRRLTLALPPLRSSRLVGILLLAPLPPGSRAVCLPPAATLPRRPTRISSSERIPVPLQDILLRIHGHGAIIADVRCTTKWVRCPAKRVNTFI